MNLRLFFLYGLAAVVAGCGGERGSDGDSQPSALTSDFPAAGLAEGSAEAKAVLLLVNDRSLTVEDLVAKVHLSSVSANAIVATRNGHNGTMDSQVVDGQLHLGGDDEMFETLGELDNQPGVDTAAFAAMATYAISNNYLRLDDAALGTYRALSSTCVRTLCDEGPGAAPPLNCRSGPIRIARTYRITKNVDGNYVLSADSVVSGSSEPPHPAFARLIHPAGDWDMEWSAPNDLPPNVEGGVIRLGKLKAHLRSAMYRYSPYRGEYESDVVACDDLTATVATN